MHIRPTGFLKNDKPELKYDIDKKIQEELIIIF